jgi:hypothetical protein
MAGELMRSGRHNFLRTRLFQMDRRTQADEIRKLSAAPDFMLGSVQAITQADQLVAASASGSQLGPLCLRSWAPDPRGRGTSNQRSAGAAACSHSRSVALPSRRL